MKVKRVYVIGFSTLDNGSMQETKDVVVGLYNQYKDKGVDVHEAILDTTKKEGNRSVPSWAQ